MEVVSLGDLLCSMNETMSPAFDLAYCHKGSTSALFLNRNGLSVHLLTSQMASIS